MYKIDQLTEIDLGVVQENEATEIEIDVSPWLKKWPDGIFAVNVCRPGEMEPYPANCRVEDGMLYWLVTEGELAIAGNGRCDIRLYQGTVKKKTRIAITRIHETLPGSTQEEPPEAAQGWLDALNETKAATDADAKVAEASRQAAKESEDKALESQQAAKESETEAGQHKAGAESAKTAAENARAGAEKAWQDLQQVGAQANTISPDKPATAEYDKTQNKLIFGIPQGIQGQKGDKGDQGFAPTVSVSKTGKITTITITDKDGTKTFQVLDGADGEGAGDMRASLYDPDGDYKVEKAEYADNAGHATNADNAGHATSADNATKAGHATSADNATNATNAVNATNATNAATAANAEKLGGLEPSAYRKTADQIDYNSEIKNKPPIPSVPPVDTAVTAGSGNPVSGGAVKTYVDGKTAGGLTSMTTLVQFLATGWTLDMFGTGNYVQEVDIDAYENPLDLNKTTDDIIVDVKIPNLYKDEVREAWAELQDFEITDEGKLRGIFFTAPTVNIMVSLMRIRKGA